MKVCATIPIKCNSTRVPGKNFRELKGKPLFQHIIDNCIQSDIFDSIYVDTDSEEIKKYAESKNINYIDRKVELTYDTANGNDVLNYDIELLTNQGKQYDYIFQLYATAPFLTPVSIRECVFKLTHSSKYDSVLTATEEYGWYWYKNMPVNYIPNILPRSQDVTPMIKETTGLYGISYNSWYKYRSRIGANPYFYILNDLKESIDLDTEKDFKHANSL